MDVNNFCGSDACMGYVIIAMRKHGMNKKLIRKIITAMSWEFDSFSAEEAENVLKSWIDGKKECSGDCLNCEYKDCIVPESVLKPSRYKPRTREQKDSKNAWGRNRYYQCKVNGICTRCGRRPAFDGKLLCYECSIKEKRRRQRRHMKNYNPDKCCMCDNPVKPGYKVCQAHWERLAEMSKKGVETMQQRRKQERIQQILEKYSLVDDAGNEFCLE